METREGNTEQSVSREIGLAFLRILAVIFVCEAAVMVVLRFLTVDGLWAVVLDPVLLAGLSTPFLYRLIVSPIRDALEQRKQAEEALRASRQELAAVFENGPIPTVLVDKDWRVREANRAAAESGVRTAGEMIGLRGGEALRCPHVLNDPKGCGFGPSCETCQIRLLVTETLQTGKAHHRVEATYHFAHDAERGERHVLLSTTRIDSGRDDRVLTSIEDVTDRKQAEEALNKAHDELERRVEERATELMKANEQLRKEIDERRQIESFLRASEQKYHTLVENLHDMVYSYRADGTVYYVSPNLVLWTGYTSQEVLGRTFIEFVHPDDRERVLSDYEKTIRTGEGFLTVFRLLRKDGSHVHVEELGKTLSEGGKVVAVTGILRDVTERKRAEEALEQNKKALAESERLAAAGRMAAQIAHEINNPLAGIANSFQLVKRAIPEDHRHYKFAEVIEKEIDRIGRIVHQMFDLYRPGQEKIEDVAVRATIEEVVAMLEPSCRQHEVRMAIDVALPEATVKAPESSFRQLLYNLIKNAIEASPPGAIIKIASTIVENEEGNAVHIVVADEGAGVPEAARNHIFEPFFTTKRGVDSGGVGLGLSICKGIVNSLGGSLDFQSSSGIGTTFRVILPFETGK